MKEKPARSPGRPRRFDVDEALDVALGLFWARGFEGVSIDDLTAAIGIGRPSLYAAFGDKRSLFRKALDVYEAREGKAIAEALADAPTAHDAVQNALRAAAINYTREGPGRARGCMVSSGLLGCTLESGDVASLLRDRRSAARDAILDRLRRGVAEGNVPEDVDLEALAHFYAAVMQGMSVQARDGARHADMTAIVEIAMTAWPHDPRI